MGESSAQVKPDPKVQLVVGAIVIALLVIGLKVLMRPDAGSSVNAWLMAQEFVTDRLKSPSTATFGWQKAEDCVTELGGGEFKVRGWVDAQNSFGATLRSDFSLTLRYTGSGKWEIVEGPYIRTP